MRAKYWPWLVASLTGLAITFAADTYLKSRDVIPVSRPLAEPVGSLNSAPLSHGLDPAGRRKTKEPTLQSPNGTQGIAPSSRNKGEHPLSEQERAIRRLEAQGLKPGGLALAEATKKGIRLAVDLFLKAGVSPNACDSEGRPALVVACEAGHREIIGKLLNAGADCNSAGMKGETPLMIAAAKSDTELMEALMAKGADIARQDANGHNAFHYAVLAESIPAVQWLITHQAPAGDSCCNGTKSLLAHALEKGNLQLIEPVLQHLKPAEWADVSREALLDGIRRQNKPLITVLLANHSEAPTLEGATQPLLGYMIAWGDPAALRLLLECGADPNTPLKSPVEPGFSKLVSQKFVRHYLDNEGGMTPLMLAAGTGNLECVQALMEHGAKRGASTDKSKFVALSFGARTTPEIMQVLLGKSPRPEDQHTRVEISLSNQVARVWKDDQLVMTSSVSTGKPGFRTPSGRFVITDKHRVRTSSIYHVDMPYFMRLSCSEVGMHAGNVPNYPASHGCIRLPYGNAARFFGLLEVGTLVTIR